VFVVGHRSDGAAEHRLATETRPWKCHVTARKQRITHTGDAQSVRVGRVVAIAAGGECERDDEKGEGTRKRHRMPHDATCFRVGPYPLRVKHAERPRFARMIGLKGRERRMHGVMHKPRIVSGDADLVQNVTRVALLRSGAMSLLLGYVVLATAAALTLLALRALGSVDPKRFASQPILETLPPRSAARTLARRRRRGPRVRPALSGVLLEAEEQAPPPMLP
jgi:hypothetical protein